MMRKTRHQQKLEEKCLAVRMTPISKLVKHQINILTSLPPDPELTESIREHGIIHPVILDTDGFIIDGTHRVNSAISLGLKHVPTRSIKGP